MTQNNLGAVLQILGEREQGSARLLEAVEAYRAALQEYTHERVPLDWAMSWGNQGVTLSLLAERQKDRALAVQALAQIKEAELVMREGGNLHLAAYFAEDTPQAQAVIDRLSAPVKPE